MKEVIMFESNDGEIFADMQECLRHEKKVKHTNMIYECLGRNADAETIYDFIIDKTNGFKDGV